MKRKSKIIIGTIAGLSLIAAISGNDTPTNTPANTTTALVVSVTKPTTTPASVTKPPTTKSVTTQPKKEEYTYALNTNTKKFHYQSCSVVGRIKPSHKKILTGTRSKVLKKGYSPCEICHP